MNTSDLINKFPHLTPSSEFSGRGQCSTTNIRKHLKKLFPDTKFRVTNKHSVNISWTDGPSYDKVKSEISIFDYSDFDPQTDYHGIKSSEFTNAFGGEAYIFFNQDLSDETITKILDRLNANNSEEQIITLSDYKTNNIDHYISGGDAYYHFNTEFNKFKDAYLGNYKTKYKQEVLNEVKLARVYQHYKNDDIPVATITAFRYGNTYKQNVARNKELALTLKNAGYGFVYVDGGWIETDNDTGVKTPVSEDSILVIGDKNDNGKLRKLVVQLANKYEQDGVLFKAEGGSKIIILSKHGFESKLSNKFTKKKLEDGYTTLRGGRHGKTFAFESERDIKLSWVNKKLHNNNDW